MALRTIVVRELAAQRVLPRQAVVRLRREVPDEALTWPATI